MSVIRDEILINTASLLTNIIATVSDEAVFIKISSRITQKLSFTEIIAKEYV